MDVYRRQSEFLWENRAESWVVRTCFRCERYVRVNGRWFSLNGVCTIEGAPLSCSAESSRLLRVFLLKLPRVGMGARRLNIYLE